MEFLKEQDEEDAESMLWYSGLSYYQSGDPGRALDMLNRIGWTDADDLSRGLVLKSMALLQMGMLADAERSVRESINMNMLSDKDDETLEIGILTLAMVLIRRGQYKKGSAWLSDPRAKGKPYSDIQGFFGPLDLLELGMIALRQDNITSAQALAQRAAARAEELDRPLARIQTSSLSAAVAETLGEHERAHELFNNALVLARETRLADNEAQLLIQLGEWNARGSHLSTARKYAADALQVAEHGQLKLRQVDAANLLSRVERASGNQRKASIAAGEAYRLAWCDGPPFSYELGIQQARENLAAVGEQEPTGLLPFNSATQMPELVIVQLDEDDMNPAALRTLYESPTCSPEIRSAALKNLVNADGDSDIVMA